MSLAVPDAAARDALADVVARVVRLDPVAAVRLRGAGDRDAGERGEGKRVALWAPTPFDVLVGAEVAGSVTPDDVTVMGSDLLAALSVVSAPVLDPGRPVDDRWRGAVPEGVRWDRVGEVTATEVEAVAARGIAEARAGSPSGAPSPALQDGTALEVGELRIPMRCVLAMAGMGWPTGDGPVAVAVSDDGAWLRLGPGGGAIVRHRRPRLTWV